MADEQVEQAEPDEESMLEQTDNSVREGDGPQEDLPQTPMIQVQDQPEVTG